MMTLVGTIHLLSTFGSWRVRSWPYVLECLYIESIYIFFQTANAKIPYCHISGICRTVVQNFCVFNACNVRFAFLVWCPWYRGSI